MWNCFWENRSRIEEQYRNVHWIIESGLEPEKLQYGVEKITRDGMLSGEDRSILKARAIEYVLDHAQLAVEPSDLFQDHIRHGFLVQKQRQSWINEEMSGPLKVPAQSAAQAEELGLGSAHNDFGHTVPDWDAIIELGIPGLLERIREMRCRHEKAGTLSRERSVFYASGEIVYSAICRYILRLAHWTQKAAEAAGQSDALRLEYCAADLRSIAEGAPQTLHQALQLAYIYHILQEEIEGERLRSLGGLDRIYLRFMHDDIESSRMTMERIQEQWQTFFQKFHALSGDTLYGEPMFLGGVLPDGSCAVNEFSYVILDAYDSLNVANPKIHIRVSDHTPDDFIRQVLDCIRRGNSAFVFINDNCAIEMMMRHVGASLEEARNYVPVGCYEPGVLGKEVACTENGGISLPKAVELALNRGKDPSTGIQVGPDTGSLEAMECFDQFMSAVKTQIRALAIRMINDICAFEKRYMRMNPSPLFSGTMLECVEAGRDAYAGGAKYNSSSLYAYGNGTAADSLSMIRKWVFERKELMLTQLNEILLENWKNSELLRLKILRDPDKWGNNRHVPDEICVDITDCFADTVNSASNARGGRFKAALFSIHHNYYFGSKCGATADGRLAGQHISRNAGAVTAMDRNGVTALIQSAGKLHQNEFPTGNVLDIMLHPSAVQGEDGLNAFFQLVKTYFKLGGFAIHGNVMDADILKDAQINPEKYPNLQVRVCGWNVYFVNLAREEQDEFITRAGG